MKHVMHGLRLGLGSLAYAVGGLFLALAKVCGAVAGWLVPEDNE